VKYDLVIRNGFVVDGSGLAAYRADVGIVGERIATIGRISARGETEIDAEGHVVTPGFVECHTHLDAQVFWDYPGSNSCWHGITTAVMGHCGFTIAPGSAEQRALVVRNLERAEDMSAAVLDAGIDWSWTDFGEYLDALDALPKGLNYVPQVGHSAVRCHVMGERAFSDLASEADLAAMAKHVEHAMKCGAWGFTTSRTIHHQTPEGDPVASRLASWSEVEQLVRVAASVGSGMYQYVEDLPADPEEARRHENALVALSAETGFTFVIAAMAKPDETLRFLESAAARGARFVGVTHPRGIGNWSSFETVMPFDKLPEWKAVRAAPLAQQRVLLRDAALRKRLVEAALGASYGEGTGAEARPPDYDRMRLLSKPIPPHPTIRELARARCVDPVTAIIDLALEADLGQFFVQAFSAFDDEATAQLLSHPQIVAGFSDSGAHVSQMADASIATHLLAYQVRERQRLSFEHAIRLLTFGPARAWGIPGRGLVSEGFIADLNVIDPRQVGPAMPRVVNDLPTGARRIEQRSTGILATVIAGQVTIEKGEHTGCFPGRVLRRNQRSSAGSAI
jgi:N-acyl-D-aspartate/D-glutamate deacylase